MNRYFFLIDRVSILCLICICGATLRAQSSSFLARGNDGVALETQTREVLVAVESLREILQQHSLVLYQGNTPIANGILMSAEGYALTKSSEIPEGTSLTVRYNNTRYKDIVICARDVVADVALMKLPLDNAHLLPQEDAVQIGDIVVSNGASTRTQRRARLGVISAKTRSIPQYEARPMLGILFNRYEGLLVQEIMLGLSAAGSSLRIGDTLVAINNKKITSPEELLETIKECSAGMKIPVEVMRKGKQFRFDMTLQEAPASEDKTLGQQSTRFSDFPLCHQHSTPLGLENMGGPLLNMEGKCVGVNIARANRAETYALTMKAVREAYARLLSQVKKKK